MPKPDFSYERKLWKKGYKLVIGVDEVGRGAFAGPVVAGAVSFRIKNQESRITERRIKNISRLGINDSKRLTAKKREGLVKEIKKRFNWAVGEGSVSEINRFGIRLSTEKAVRRAVIKLIMKEKFGNSHNRKTIRVDEIPKTCLLVDAFFIRYVMGIGLKNQKAITNGDSKCISIASASIIAKVYRDTLMHNLSLRYNKYQWQKNMGYGTYEHRQAIGKYGAIKHHREKFIRNWA